ncbi:Hint domain-containing protein [Epibacterium ulvae]|uniref:Hint domain-containing protein n=1 Tax=Epibacterium ulvae TaxID=1156985 RepID=UPI002492478D|nr:Hint domain-containing protein [Epibacterium ulvae]
MAANLSGIRFDQVYGDNSGGAAFDTDGDGTATQEDEFVSFTNSSGAPLDISGWQVWSDSAGFNAPDIAQDGLFHTFPAGTVLSPGETLYVVNEISGSAPVWAQEASEGGVESGAGGTSTNFLSEGMSDATPEAVALVNPGTGEYITFNMSSTPPEIESLPGFPGTVNLGTVDGHTIQDDYAAGYSYQFNDTADAYEYDKVFVPCFASGTLIETPDGPKPVETLAIGDLIITLDNGPQPLRHILIRKLDFSNPQHQKDHPIAFDFGALGSGRPHRKLVVSPQHRMLIHTPTGQEVLVPAKALLKRPGVRQLRSCKRITYHHLVFEAHQVVISNGAPTESFYAGPVSLQYAPKQERAALLSLPEHEPARALWTVKRTAQHAAQI